MDHQRQNKPSETKWVEPLSDFKTRALDAASEGITITDCTHPDNPIIYVNAGFERLTGYAPDEVIGQNCRFLQGEQADDQTTALLRQAIQEEREVTVEIRNYRKDGTAFWNRLSITPVRDEAGRMTHLIGLQTDVTKRRQAEEALQTAKQELETANRQMKNDLRAAAQIQQAQLPQELPQFRGVQFAWQFHPCEELAGDILNVFPLDEEHVGLYVLDVSGHGVSAALLSVSLSHWLTPQASHSGLFLYDGYASSQRQLRTPAEVLQQLNLEFPLDHTTGQYFTILYGILDLRTNEFRYVSAGHPPAIYVPSQGPSRVLDVSGFPVGIMPEPHYAEQKLVLQPGDRMYFYSDGIEDAVNADEEFFGQFRFLDAIEQGRPVPLSDSVEQILNRAEIWCSPNTANDDITLLALEIQSKPESGMAREPEYSI